MTGPKGKSEFSFPETLSVPQSKAEGNIEIKGKQNSLFLLGSVIAYYASTLWNVFTHWSVDWMVKVLSSGQGYFVVFYGQTLWNWVTIAALSNQVYL